MQPTQNPDDLFDAVVRARQIAEFWRESGNRFQAIAALEQYLDARDALVTARHARTVTSVDNSGAG